MAFKINTDNNNTPQNTKHCVLIDGDFGRHELFNNVHIYTLNRLGKVNDALTFKIHTEEDMKLMNDPSNIHYHIFYNSLSTDVNEYYKVLKVMYPQSVWLHSSISTAANAKTNYDSILKWAADDCKHESDYIWIIHGIEDHYEEFIKQLKSNNKSQVNIFSYSWLENLKDGSNRIEYLTNNKMKSLIENRIEEINIQAATHGKTATTTDMSTKAKPKKSNKRQWITCDVDGCKQQFKQADALKDHQLAKHPSTQTVVHNETKTKASTTKRSTKTATKQKIAFNVDGWLKKFRTIDAWHKHYLLKHLYHQTVTDGETTLTSSMEHRVKSKKKLIVPCDVDGCKKNFRIVDAWHNHYLFKHLYHQTDTDDETATSSTENPEQTIRRRKKECRVDNCRQSYNKLRPLHIHQVETHPIPLRCPFSEECWNSNEKYLGILYLQNHIIFQHANSISQSICPIPRCTSSKSWQDWSALLEHIIF